MSVAPVPVNVLGGYLGSGKTTALNLLLSGKQAERIAVIVNDFGDINIDASLIGDRAGVRIDLANGCVCCQAGDSLGDAFFEVLSLVPPVERVVVETSGVALPRAVAGWASLPGLRLDSVVVLVDSLDFRRLAVDPLVGSLVRRQIADADLVVVTKVDAAPVDVVLSVADEVAEVRRELCGPNQVEVLFSGKGEVPIEMMFGAAPVSDSERGAPLDGDPMVADHRTLFVSVVFRPEGRTDVDRVLAVLCRFPGVVRAKGMLRHRDGSVQLVQVVGSRGERSAWSGPPNAPQSDDQRAVDCIVVIGLRSRLDGTALLAELHGTATVPMVLPPPQPA